MLCDDSFVYRTHPVSQLKTIDDLIVDEPHCMLSIKISQVQESIFTHFCWEAEEATG